MSPKKLITLDTLDVFQGGKCVCRVGPWELRSGERWWVRGPNGSGKSSVLSVLAGELWPAPGQHERRRYHLDGETTWSPLAARGHVALLNPVRQNRYLHQDWDLRAAEVVATGFLDTDLLHERPNPRQYDRLTDVMQQLDITRFWDRPFLELSQGERRRVLIARALATDPQILLLDEFAEGLDRASRETLWNTLESLAAAGKTIVLTTHRPGLALQGWQTLDVEHPPPPPRKPAPDAASTWARAKGEETIVRARGDLYLEGRLLIRDLDWTLSPGSHTVVSGANGCGKTSLLRLLWGELHLACGGEVVHFGDPQLTVSALRRRVSHFQPDLHAWFRPEQEAQDIILSGFFSTIDLVDPVTDEQRVQMQIIAEALGAAAFLQRPFGTLSYGQARRVLLARTLVARPRLALLDEPFDGLDRNVRAALMEYLQEVALDGETTFVLTSHHEDDVPAWIHEHLIITPDRSLEKLRDCTANLG